MRFPILRPILRPSLGLAALCAVGCVSTDPTVFVEPSIDAPAAAVSGGALGVNVAGGFTLKLHLGPRASGPSEVSLGTFAIVDAAQNGSIVESLALASDTGFPVTVDLDSDVAVALTFDTGSKPESADVKDRLCDPAGVVIQGTIQDSLEDHATPVASAVFQPTCQ